MTQLPNTTNDDNTKIQTWVKFKTKGMNAKQIAKFQHSLEYLHFVCVTHSFKPELCSKELLLLKAHASIRQDAIWEESLHEALKTHKLGTDEWRQEAVKICNYRTCPAPNQKWADDDWAEFKRRLQEGEFEMKDVTLAILAKDL